MTIEGKRIAIVVEQDFEDVELMEPLKAMKSAGARVTLVGSGTQQKYRGKKGTEIRVDTTAEKVNADDIDAVIVPGGYAPDKMRLHQPMINLVKKANDAGKLIAAVCHGPHASLMLKQGIHPKVVQERLGHASIQVTLDLYSHVAPGLQEAAAVRFDEWLAPQETVRVKEEAVENVH